MITCQICQHQNPEGTEYCENCGASLSIAGEPAASPAAQPAPEVPSIPQESLSGAGDLQEGAADAPVVDASPAEPDLDALSASNATPTPAAIPSPAASSAPSAGAVTGTGLNARLVARRYGAASGEEIPLLGDRLVIGRFDQETGPVDIDLENTPEAGQISRHHAEMYREADGVWHVRDLGSTNGVFIKRAGAGTFGPRITAPEAVNNGDEIAFGNARFVMRTD